MIIDHERGENVLQERSIENPRTATADRRLTTATVALTLTIPTPTCVYVCIYISTFVRLRFRTIVYVSLKLPHRESSYSNS